MFSRTCAIGSFVLGVVIFTVTVMSVVSMQRHPHQDKAHFFYRSTYQNLCLPVLLSSLIAIKVAIFLSDIPPLHNLATDRKGFERSWLNWVFRISFASIYSLLFIQYSVLAIYARIRIQFKAVPAVRRANRKDRFVLAAIIVLGVTFGGWTLQWPVHFERFKDGGYALVSNAPEEQMEYFTDAFLFYQLAATAIAGGYNLLGMHRLDRVHSPLVQFGLSGLLMVVFMAGGVLNMALIRLSIIKGNEQLFALAGSIFPITWDLITGQVLLGIYVSSHDARKRFLRLYCPRSQLKVTPAEQVELSTMTVNPAQFTSLDA
ncbi:unnamed protein product [Caenorhabditis sp. 36 PRJEB53466]|nr:unnamed protein product [Caenorhabditis sp. 36 PRJEB53466]